MELPDRIEGLLIREVETGIDYRIYREIHGYIECVVVSSQKLEIRHLDAEKFATDCFKDKYIIVPEQPRIVNESLLSVRDRKDYTERLNIVRALKEACHGDLLSIRDRKNSEAVKSVYKSYGMKKDSFRVWLIRYLQSGEQNYSLLNQYQYVNGKSRTISRNISVKLGRKPRVEQGRVLTEYDYDVFDVLLKEYLKAKGAIAFSNLWIEVRQKYYNEVTINGTGSARKLVDICSYPTERQARNYVDKRITPEQKAVIKESEREVRLKLRNLDGDSRNGADGPMDICECDTWDCGIELIDEKGTRLGHPSVIAIIDNYTGAVLTAFITLNADCIVGLSGMMLTLLDKKIGTSDTRENVELLWFPGPYLPSILRVDRGPDFISNAFGTICNRLGINRELVPGAMGSLKGNIERLWGRIDSKLCAHVRKFGRVNHVHGEKPYKNAQLTLQDYSKIVIEAIAAINAEPILGYPLDSDMIDANLIPTPRNLWEFGVRKMGEPRSIRNAEQFMFDMMLEGTAKVKRDGIFFNGLMYENHEDSRLERMRFKAQNRGEPLEIRYDPRSVNYIWYQWPDEPCMRRMTLDSNKTGMDSFRDMTWQQYQVYLEKKKDLLAEAKIIKDQVKTAAYLAESAAVNEIVKEKKGDRGKTAKPTKEARLNAKQEERKEEAISERLNPVEQKKSEEKQNEPVIIVDFDEALDNYDED